MTVFWIVFGQMISLLLMTGAGWGLGRLKLVSDTRQLSALLSRVCLPAMVLATLQAPYSTALLRDIGLSSLGTLVTIIVGMALGMLLALLLRRGRGERWCWGLCVGFANTIFMGRPVMVALYGEAVEPLLAGIVLCFNLLVFSLGSLAAAKSAAGDGKAGGGPALSLRRVLLNPVVLASLAGFLLFLAPFRLPGAVNGALSALSGMTTPLSMVLLGVELSAADPRALLRGPAWSVSLCRLILVPCASWALMRLFISDPMLLGVLTAAAAMPVASTATVILTEQGGDVPFSTTATTLSNLLCVITVPVTLSLLLG